MSLRSAVPIMLYACLPSASHEWAQPGTRRAKRSLRKILLRASCSFKMEWAILEGLRMPVYRKVMTVRVAVAAAATSLGLFASSAAAGPILFWDMNHVTGGTTVADQSGSNTGTAGTGV